MAVQKIRYYYMENEFPDGMEILNRIVRCFRKFVGNKKCLQKLGKLAYATMLKRDRNCGGNNLMLTGPASTGKTSIVRAFAKAVLIPYLEIMPYSLKSLDAMIDMMKKTIDNFGSGIQLVPTVDEFTYECPPMIIFVDEAHALKPEIQDALLKAVESNDRVMVTESGIKMDCRNICWMFATTDAGKLLPPLLSRFTVIELKQYSKHEIGHIIHRHFDNKIPLDACMRIAHFESRIPRRAIAFAKDVLMLREINSVANWTDLCNEVADDNGIDEHGLSEQHLRVLRLLSRGPISKDRMAMCFQISKDELEKMVMAPILSHTDDNPALVTICSKGYYLTDAGKDALSLRKIAYAA